MKKKALTLAVVLVTMLATGCGPGAKYADHGARVLMEASQAAWTQAVDEGCGLASVGRPYGTAREDYAYDEEGKVWRISFDLDEAVTQTIVDGYAQAVWNACVRASGEDPQSSRGHVYDCAQQAERRQEPLNYYIWYYCVGDKVFRVGLYPSEMEMGRPGGLVLEIQRWE